MCAMIPTLRILLSLWLSLAQVKRGTDWTTLPVFTSRDISKLLLFTPPFCIYIYKSPYI